MKNQNPLTKLMVLLALLLAMGATQAQADILPRVTINFAPVGLTVGQTARLNLVNTDIANGVTVIWRFIDPTGSTLAQSTITLPMGKIASVDFGRPGDPIQNRLQVRAQVEIVTGNISSDSIRRSLEVFNNDTGATTVCMGGAAP